MSGETTLTVIGNLTADPELRFTPSGVAVASFTVASTPRRYNAQSAQWEDGDPLFLRCSIWRQAAENLAESLTRGARVVVHRPPPAALVRDEGGRQTHRRRAHRRRGRRQPQVRHGHRRQGVPQRGRHHPKHGEDHHHR